MGTVEAGGHFLLLEYSANITPLSIELKFTFVAHFISVLCVRGTTLITKSW